MHYILAVEEFPPRGRKRREKVAFLPRIKHASPFVFRSWSTWSGLGRTMQSPVIGCLLFLAEEKTLANNVRGRLLSNFARTEVHSRSPVSSGYPIYVTRRASLFSAHRVSPRKRCSFPRPLSTLKMRYRFESRNRMRLFSSKHATSRESSKGVVS